MFRVLVVDDSATSREILAEILSGDPEIEVVGTAIDGKEALRLAQQLRPDVITMDLYMPKMDGFEATKEIMIAVPTPTVIVSSSTKVREVEAGMQALRAGALTMLLKPPGPDSPEFDRAAKELVDTVKTMADVKVVRHHRRRRPGGPAPPLPKLELPAIAGFQAVAIATSTGGPLALNALLGELPADFPVPILVVQHIATGFVQAFTDWLDSNVSLRVKVAQHRESLKPGTVYIAPQEQHLGVSGGSRVALSGGPPIGGFRPAGTHLFESVAQAFGKNVVALILTGMGRDGVDGLRTLRGVGAATVAQDEQSSVVFGMPGAAVAEDLADTVLPIEGMAKHLMDLLAGRSM